MLRKEFYKKYPGAPYKVAMLFPRAKYVPLIRKEKYREMLPDEEKTSWSFPNSLNLYGLHIAAPYIKESGEAIILRAQRVLCWPTNGVLRTPWRHTPLVVTSTTLTCSMSAEPERYILRLTNNIKSNQNMTTIGICIIREPREWPKNQGYWRNGIPPYH